MSVLISNFAYTAIDSLMISSAGATQGFASNWQGGASTNNLGGYVKLGVTQYPPYTDYSNAPTATLFVEPGILITYNGVAVAPTALFSVVWDGGAGTADTIDTDGLGAVDLTDSGTVSAFYLRFTPSEGMEGYVAQLPAGSIITITAWSNAGAQTGSATYVNPSEIVHDNLTTAIGPTSIAIAFADFSGALDFSSISALRLDIDTEAAIVPHFQAGPYDVPTPPTGDGCTWNPDQCSTHLTLSNGDLTVTSDSAADWHVVLGIEPRSQPNSIRWDETKGWKYWVRFDNGLPSGVMARLGVALAGVTLDSASNLPSNQAITVDINDQLSLLPSVDPTIPFTVLVAVKLLSWDNPSDIPDWRNINVSLQYFHGDDLFLTTWSPDVEFTTQGNRVTVYPALEINGECTTTASFTFVDGLPLGSFLDGQRDPGGPGFSPWCQLWTAGGGAIAGGNTEWGTVWLTHGGAVAGGDTEWGSFWMPTGGAKAGGEAGWGSFWLPTGGAVAGRYEGEPSLGVGITATAIWNLIGPQIWVGQGGAKAGSWGDSGADWGSFWLPHGGAKAGGEARWGTFWPTFGGAVAGGESGWVSFWPADGGAKAGGSAPWKSFWLPRGGAKAGGEAGWGTAWLPRGGARAGGSAQWGSSSGSKGGVVKLQAPMPILRVQGGGYVRLRAPMPTLSATGITDWGITHLRAPMPTLHATGWTWNAGSVQLRAPMPTLRVQGGGYVRLRAPMPTLHATGWTWNAGSVHLRAPMPTLRATGTTENIGHVRLVAPMPRMVWGYARLTAPMPRLVVRFAEPVIPIPEGQIDATITYAMNLATVAMTEYTNYGYLAVFRCWGGYYGARPNGIFRLLGDTDETLDGTAVPIACEIETHPTDYADPEARKNPADYQKRLPYAYVQHTGALSVTTIIDGRVGSDYQTLSQDDHPKRVRFARGPQGRRHALRLKNVEGGAFRLIALDPIPDILSRKV